LLALLALLSCCGGRFRTAMAGLLVWIRGGDRFLISRSVAAATLLSRQAAHDRHADLHEDVRRVFGRLRATYESQRRTGELAQFDFFVYPTATIRTLAPPSSMPERCARSSMPRTASFTDAGADA
jgi:membrane glycosyltransferase